MYIYINIYIYYFLKIYKFVNLICTQRDRDGSQWIGFIFFLILSSVKKNNYIRAHGLNRTQCTKHSSTLI